MMRGGDGSRSSGVAGATGTAPTGAVVNFSPGVASLSLASAAEAVNGGTKGLGLAVRTEFPLLPAPPSAEVEILGDYVAKGALNAFPPGTCCESRGDRAISRSLSSRSFRSCLSSSWRSLSVSEAVSRSLERTFLFGKEVFRTVGPASGFRSDGDLSPWI
jgi:hypothetical protein